MGDRRVADRRAPEEGVVKIETRKLVIYLVVAIVLLVSIIINIILGVQYSHYKKSYDSITDTDNEDTYTNEVEDSLIYEGSDYTCELIISGDKEQIKAGETITYEVKAENINAGNGIVMFETLLDYDEDSFDCEVITDENMEWSKTSLVENYLTMSRKNLLPSTENQIIAKIAFTAKENIQEGEQTIDFSNIEFITDEDNSFVLPDVSMTVNVVNN